MDGWLVVAYIAGWFAFLGLMHWRRSRRQRFIDPHTGTVIKAALPRPDRWLIRAYITCYVFYAMLLPLSVVTGLMWILAVRALLPFVPIDDDWHDLAFFLIMFLLWIGIFVLVGGGEIYMRHGIAQRVGLRRLGLIAMALAVFLGLSLLILQLTGSAA
jgi:hypothetical protein